MNELVLIVDAKKIKSIALYAYLRRFHGRAVATLVPTRSQRERLAGRGFANLRLWARSVDTTVFRPGPKDLYSWPRPIMICMGRVAVRGSQGVSRAGSPRYQGGDRRWSRSRCAAGALRGRPLPRRQVRRRPGVAPGGRRCVRIPQPHRHVRPGIAGGHGLRSAGCRVPGDRADRRGRRGPHRWWTRI